MFGYGGRKSGMPSDTYLKVTRWTSPGRGMKLDVAVGLAQASGDDYVTVRRALGQMVGVSVDRLTMMGVGQLEATVTIPNPTFRQGVNVHVNTNPLTIDTAYALNMLASMGSAQHMALNVLAAVVANAKVALLASQNAEIAIAPVPAGGVAAVALAAADYTNFGAVPHGTEATFERGIKAFFSFTYMPGMQQLATAVLEYQHEAALEREDNARALKAVEKPLRASEVATFIRAAEEKLEIVLNANYIACPQQLGWMMQFAKLLKIPTDSRTEPETLKRYADHKGALLHHADGVADEQGVTKMMTVEFDKLRNCPATYSILHDNLRCFLFSLMILQDVDADELWVKPLHVYVFLDEFRFRTHGMSLGSAYQFRIDMLNWLREKVDGDFTLSRALQDVLPVMSERSKLITYSSGGVAMATAMEPGCPKCAKLTKELTAAKAEIAALKDRRASSEASRNREYNGRGRSVSRGRSESRPRRGHDSSARKVRVTSPPPRYDRGRRSRSPRRRR